MPGIDREFRPPNWQPASNTVPEANAPLRNKIRLIRRPPGRFAVPRKVPAQDPEGGRTRIRERVPGQALG
nr:hypothetical protein MFLOJ_41380 [Mycobacterium florentinum]